MDLFQSTPPVKAATFVRAVGMRQITFQSTPPVKAATGAKFKVNKQPEFQSTPPVKAATNFSFKLGRRHVISIHAAREGGDCGNE